jgi:hypothetical protein
MKNILILGDSFSYGQGCSDRLVYNSTVHYSPSAFSWPSLLNNEIDALSSPKEYAIINKSKPGNSLPGIFQDLLHYHTESVHIDLLIFTVTSINRMLVADIMKPNLTNNWILSNQTTDNKDTMEYDKSKVAFMKYLINDSILHLNGLAYITAIINYAKTYNTSCLYSTPYLPTPFSTKFLEKHTSDIIIPHMYTHDFSEVQDENFNKSCINQNDSHPNDLGHKLYYEQIIRPIMLKYIKDKI